MEIGAKIKVFKEREGDMYHRVGDWKKGIVIQKLPKFYLVLMEGNYRECFYESEVFNADENIESIEKRDI